MTTKVTGCAMSTTLSRLCRDRLANTLLLRIHYGNVVSGNEVIKHRTTRDKIAKEEDVFYFEMEAARLMDNFRCLVIRRICDYADSHKNKICGHGWGLCQFA